MSAQTTPSNELSTALEHQLSQLLETTAHEVPDTKTEPAIDTATQAPTKQLVIICWSGEYDRIMNGEYIRRGDPLDVRAEAGDAVDFYAERFRAIFREAGVGVTKAGEQVGAAAEKVADWLRSNRE